MKTCCMHDDIRNFQCLSAAAGHYMRYHKRLIDVDAIIQNMEPLIVNSVLLFSLVKKSQWTHDR